MRCPSLGGQWNVWRAWGPNQEDGVLRNSDYMDRGLHDYEVRNTPKSDAVGLEPMDTLVEETLSKMTLALTIETALTLSCPHMFECVSIA